VARHNIKKEKNKPQKQAYSMHAFGFRDFDFDPVLENAHAHQNT